MEDVDRIKKKKKWDFIIVGLQVLVIICLIITVIIVFKHAETISTGKLEGIIEREGYDFCSCYKNGKEIFITREEQKLPNYFLP